MNPDEALAGGAAGAAARHGGAGLPAAPAPPGYGYALLEELRGLGFAVDANTLYPLLRRLETQGMLASAWNTQEARPRKFYRISPDGERLAAELLAEWDRIDASVRRLGQGGSTS